ncbi:MAG: DUF4389 domain-containing protein [Flavobacteriales bacterium]
MVYHIEHQEQYSRGELLLRSFFGWFYMALPHILMIVFLSYASLLMTFLAFWAIIFTGRYPKGMYDFQMMFRRWLLRLNARLLNLTDGYPAFGIADDDRTEYRIEYPEYISRTTALLRFFFGGLYVGIPHYFLLFFRSIATYFLVFLAWWAVLFTGRYPESWHRFNVRTLRWGERVSLYLNYMVDTYPPFSGKTDEELGIVTEKPYTQPSSASSDDAA